MRYFIFSNQDQRSLQLTDYIKNILLKEEFVFDEENPEIVISIGGDGRMLKCVERFSDKLDAVKFIGISTGTLGFLCDYQVEEVDDLLNSLKSTQFEVEKKRLINVSCNEYNNYFLNEVRVEKIFNTLKCEVYINDYLLEKFRGNGFNFATPTGSSAYNRSLGGPLLDISFNGYIFGEIAPINHKEYRSINSFLILKETDVVTLKGDFKNCYVGGDTSYHEIKEAFSDEIKIKFSNKYAQFIHYKNINYIQKVKNSFVIGG